MAYLSLYRKYRSQTFADLIGQDHVVRTLQNAIETGRVSHSYLFTGPRGTGKTSTARLLAKALCCENGPSAEPDDTCEICRSITTGSCVDVIEMDAASESGVDEIREQIVEAVEYRPMICRYKIFIIDEVHDLSNKAFDALLKTIEEPPAHIIFILATTEFNKVPPTIRSRCQKFEFHRASMQDLVQRLQYVTDQEGVVAEPAAISAIARMADGGYRDGLTLLEQAMLTSDGAITLQQVYDQLGLISEEVVDQLLLAIKDGDVPKIMDLLSMVARLGRDPTSGLESIMYRMSDLTRASYQVSVEAGAEATREAALYDTASRVGRETILRLRADLADAHKTIRDISLPRLWLEAELIRLATLPTRSEPLQTHKPTTQPTSRPEAVKPKPVVSQEPVASPVTPVATAPSSTAAVEKQEQAVPAEAAPEAPEGTDIEVPQSTEAAWKKTVDELTKISRTLGLKLDGSTAIVQDNRVLLEIGPNAFDWLKAKPVTKPTIIEAVQRNFGPNMEVEYAVKRREGGVEGSGAVELPAEGAALAELARQVFGADALNQTQDKNSNDGKAESSAPSEG